VLAGAVGGSITATSVRTWYLTLTKPPGTPPNWVFAPVWTTLFVMMGVAAWRVWRVQRTGPALRLWGWQLAVNVMWTPVFFGLHSPRFALVIILTLLVLVAATIRVFLRIDRWAALLLLPYLGWSLYATYLNTGFWWLNPA